MKIPTPSFLKTYSRGLPIVTALAAVILLAACKTTSPDAESGNPDATSAAAPSPTIEPFPDEPPVVTPQQSPATDSPEVTTLPPTNPYRVAAERTIFTVANTRGQDPGAGGRAIVLTKGTEFQPLTPADTQRVKVRLATGRIGYVFSKDIEPVPAVAPVVSAPVLDEGSAQPAFPVSRPPTPAEPVDPALIREANQLEMPDL